MKKTDGLLAETIADKYSNYGKRPNGDDCIVLEYTDAIKAMKEHHEARLKEELVKFANDISEITFSEIWNGFASKVVDEYLKQRTNGNNS